MNENDSKPRRFWKAAAVGPHGEAGFTILLDGRPALTPRRARLALPTRALAQLVAHEWDDVGEYLELATMPLTRLAFTAIDRVSKAREAVADEVARYAAADALCYFADTPAKLVERQIERWGPMLDWAERDLGLTFERATGILHKPQPEATVARVRELALDLDDFALTGLTWATSLFGSAILAFAVLKGELDAVTAFDLSRLDERFQVEQWGEDAEAAERAKAMGEDAISVGKWLDAADAP
ncbi:MAG TPA: ATP12 family protein [Caulobacteraceae bacterium]|jgi:chaperone required for assembly of F1-ATPase|nr:ATP12 family protein [Caulobacteraceae bacterium]